MDDQAMSYFRLTTLTTALIIGLAGCSKYHNTEWVDMDRGWRMKIANNTAVLEDPVLGRTATIPVTFSDHGSIYLWDDNAAFFGGRERVYLSADRDFLTSSVIDFTIKFAPATVQTEEVFDKALAHKRAAHAYRQRPLPESDDGYVSLSPIDLRLLIAAHRTEASRVGANPYGLVTTTDPFVSRAHRDMTDEELANEFIPGFGKEKDAFKRAEMAQNAPKIRAAMDGLRGRGDVRLADRTREAGATTLGFPIFDTPSSTLDGYDFESQSFAFTNARTPCTTADSMEYPYQVYRHPVGLMNWVTDAVGPCRIEVRDLELAKRIEAARAANRLRMEADVFIRLTGEMWSNERFGLTPVFEAQKVRVFISEDIDGNPVRLGPSDGFVITPDLTITRSHFRESPETPKGAG